MRDITMIEIDRMYNKDEVLEVQGKVINDHVDYYDVDFVYPNGYVFHDMVWKNQINNTVLLTEPNIYWFVERFYISTKKYNENKEYYNELLKQARWKIKCIN